MTTITITRILTGSDAGDIAITAAEGGINYWAIVDEYDYLRWSPYTNTARDAIGTSNIEVGDDFIFYTITGTRDDGKVGGLPVRVTPSLIARGIELYLTGVRHRAEGSLDECNTLMAELDGTCQNPNEHSPDGNPWHFEPRAFDDMEDFAMMDAIEADCVIQLGAFGKLIFG